MPEARLSATAGMVLAGVMWFTSGIWSMTSSYIVDAWPLMDAPLSSAKVVAEAKRESFLVTRTMSSSM